MRALFFLLDGVDNASSRHRVVQYLPYLKAHGVQVEVVPPTHERLLGWLSDSGASPRKALLYATFFASRTVAILRANAWNVVGIQRDLFPYGPPVLERLLHRLNPALLYDTDDATHIPPPFTPNNVFQRLRRFDKVPEVLGMCRQVTVATPALATYARQFNAHVTVVPMAVDSSLYETVARQRAQRIDVGPPRAAGSATDPSAANAVTVGWTGTAGGFVYLSELAPVLARVATSVPVRYRFISGGWRDLALPGLDYEALPWEAASELARLASFDIGLVPLADMPFERAKFPFKLLQYMALGIPPICSRVGFAQELIEDGVNGYLAATAEEWEQRLLELAQDAPRRQRMGQEARAAVRERFTTENTAPLLLEALLKAAS